ncbi:MAG: S1/P1 nuclease, partial [Sinomicrobium sp.]|nr:S1/P1 nuclease [Sinomicrobium sp.]
MKLFAILLFTANLAWSNTVVWGPTGHRVVGKVAEEHLSGRAKRAVKKLLGGTSLALASTFADEIKSDREYREYSPWHYVNMALDKKYGEEPVSEDGDLVRGIEKCIAVLKDKNAPDKDKAFYLKMLVHFIGDLHQPLHIGRAE